MAQNQSLEAPWSPSPERTPNLSGTQERAIVRELTFSDTENFRELLARDPIANVYLIHHLEAEGTAAAVLPGTRILGYFDADSQLVAASWAGVNVIPTPCTLAAAAALGKYLSRSRNGIGSIYGPAEAVMGVHAQFAARGAQSRSVRPDQLLMAIDQAADVAAPDLLETATTRQLESVLPASASMFEEEVGYSPYIGGSQGYRRKVAGLLAKGHTVARFDAAGKVIFKADFGVVTEDVVQVHGVWLAPAYRGQGLSEKYMADVVNAGLDLAPTVSLYVNSYNHRALAAYRKVGFAQVGSYATVLF